MKKIQQNFYTEEGFVRHIPQGYETSLNEIQDVYTNTKSSTRLRKKNGKREIIRMDADEALLLCEDDDPASDNVHVVDEDGNRLKRKQDKENMMISRFCIGLYSPLKKIFGDSTFKDASLCTQYYRMVAFQEKIEVLMDRFLSEHKMMPKARRKKHEKQIDVSSNRKLGNDDYVDLTPLWYRERDFEKRSSTVYRDTSLSITRGSDFATYIDQFTYRGRPKTQPNEFMETTARYTYCQPKRFSLGQLNLKYKVANTQDQTMWNKEIKIVELREYISRFKQPITKLDLSCNSLNDNDVPYITYIAERLGECSEIDLSCNHIVGEKFDDTIHHLKNILALEHIQYLIIYGNDIATEKGKMFFNMLQDYQLKKLIWLKVEWLKSKWHVCISDQRCKKIVLETHKRYYKIIELP